MDENPYTEITQIGDGKVDVETDNNRVRVEPLQLKAGISNEFTNKITYYLYLSTSLKTMRYAKNCGKHMIHKIFDDPDLLVFSTEITKTGDQIKAESNKKPTKLDKILKKNHVNISFTGLDPNKKYYGIVVAKVDLFPLEEGYLTSIRSGKSYYDEFIVITPRVTFPIQLIISSFIIFGILAAVFCIVKSYIFGNINQLNEIGERIPESLKEFDDESSFGFKAFSLLEKAYYEEKKRMEEIGEEGVVSEIEEEQEAGKSTDIESGDREIELQDQNDAETPLDG